MTMPPPPAMPPPQSPAAYHCPFCRRDSAGLNASCPHCGAPVDVRLRRDNSGWVIQPGVADMARVQFGQSHAQISGKAVPVCDVTLAAGDAVFFYHTELLWLAGATLDSVPSPGGIFARSRAGIPRLIMRATGPGNVALSADWPGEMLIVPLSPGQTVLATEHHMLMSTASVTYQPVDTGLFISENEKNYQGDIISRYVNAFSAQGSEGLLVLHAPGNVLVRDLADGESIFVQPGSIIYVDATVRRQLYTEGARQFFLSGGLPHPHWTHLAGPGRVAISSVYEHIPPTPGCTSADAGPGASSMNQVGSRGGLTLGGAFGGGLLGSILDNIN
jgi:uncharacterized protein (AIM24 family)